MTTKEIGKIVAIANGLSKNHEISIIVERVRCADKIDYSCNIHVNTEILVYMTSIIVDYSTAKSEIENIFEMLGYNQ